MESWNSKTNAENGSECEPQEDTKEEATQALHHTNRIKLHKKTVYVSKTQAGQRLKKTLMQKNLLSVDMMPGVRPYEEITTVTVNRERFGTENVISNELASSLKCLVVGTQDPEETVDITQNNSTVSVKTRGATIMWIRFPNTPGHNKNDGPLAFIQIIMKVSESLDAGRFQCVLNTSTMETLKMLPPSREKSLQETKQAAKRLRKQMWDMTRRQEVFRIKKLHENIEKNRRHNTTASSHAMD